MAIGIGSFVALLVLEYLIPKVPATIVVVAVSLLLVSALSLDDLGVEVVGDIPSGFALHSKP